MALRHGSRPAFFYEEPILPYPDLTALLKLCKFEPATTDSQHGTATLFLAEIDDELARAWRALSEFCSLINFAVDYGQLISTETFLDTMASVVYRLLDMCFEESGSILDETIRLGLLAFSCVLFLQWKDLGMSYSHLASTFRAGLARLTSVPSHIISSSQLMLWLLMVGAVSVFDGQIANDNGDDRWLKPLLLVNMDLCGIHSWSEMRDLLESFMWIGLVHDKPGKAVFDSAVVCLGQS